MAFVQYHLKFFMAYRIFPSAFYFRLFCPTLLYRVDDGSDLGSHFVFFIDGSLTPGVYCKHRSFPVGNWKLFAIYDMLDTISRDLVGLVEFNSSRFA